MHFSEFTHFEKFSVNLTLYIYTVYKYINIYGLHVAAIGLPGSKSGT